MKKILTFLTCVLIATQVVLAKEYAVVNIPISKQVTEQRPKLMKRVIADTISKQDIEFFKNKGCLIKHRLRDATSLDCPENIVSQLNVRESRIFRITDLESDKQISADKVWAEGIDGTGVKVVILDTGVQEDHIELSDSYLGGWDFLEDDNVPQDPHGHGTHVAGIITANGVNTIGSNKATGVAPGAGFYMLRVCDENGNCLEDDMVAAMEYAVNNLDAKVMSISIGGGNFGGHCDYDSLAAKVNWVVQNGITVAVSSGNDGKGVSSPACAFGAIAVGAVDKNGYVASWSNKGSALDIVAPGVSILSSYSCLAAGDCTTTWYAYMTGTSMSAPHVSGVIALLLETYPSASTDEIKTALYTTATPAKCRICYTFWGWTWCWNVACNSEDEGAGIVNAYEAYLYILGTIPTTTTSTTTTSTSTTTTSTSTTTTTTTSTTTTSTTTTTTSTSTTTTTTSSTTTTTEGPTTTTTTSITTTTTVPTTTTTSTTITTSTTTSSTTTTLPTVTQCWDGEYKYLRYGSSQFRKFCKCAQGTYGYNSFSFSFGTRTVYYYLDSGNNKNWDVSSRTVYFSAYQVICTDGQPYPTNQDYYYG